MNNKDISKRKSNHKVARILRPILALFFISSLLSCNKYLDIVPDNVATIDHAFNMRNEAEKYLFTCYSFLPRDGDPLHNVGYMAGDEVWVPTQEWDFLSYGWRIARGGQSAANPYLNTWIGNHQGGGPGDNNGLFK